MKYIDFHVHIDHYENINEILKKCEENQILTLFVTNLPEIFEKHNSYYKNFKNMRLAIGYHPDLISSKEYPFNEKLFKRQLLYTKYIGEVGLDFSKHNIPYKDKQIEVFKKIVFLGSIMDKVFTIHSRKAEKEVVEILEKYHVKKAVFHWYTGPLKLIEKILDLGYYFSVNIGMLKSINGRKILEKIPLDRIILESDGPFTKYNGKIYSSEDIESIYKEFELFYGINNLKEIIYENLRSLLKD